MAAGFNPVPAKKMRTLYYWPDPHGRLLCGYDLQEFPKNAQDDVRVRRADVDAGVPAAGEPLVRLHTSYYYIDGPSATVLAAQLDQNGPVGTDGSHYAGRTRWDVQWKFRHEQQGTSCSMKDVAVMIGVAQTMPRWRGEDKGAAGLKTLWTKFLDSLQRHEDGHKEHGLKAGKEIEAAVLAVKPASNCEDLERRPTRPRRQS